MDPLNNQFPLVVSNDRVKADIDPQAKRISRVVYGIFDSIENKMIYVGKTGQALARRVSWYTCMINKCIEGKPVERASLVELLASDPTRYYFTILEEATQDEHLSDVEQRAIETHQPLMNRNGGGGGGSSFLSPSAKQRRVAPNHFDSPITPEKNYSVDFDEEGQISAAITPTSRNLENVIYRIRNFVTGEVYIGQTSGTFGKRIASHMWRANADDNKVIRGALHQAIAEHPENFDVGIIRSFDEDFNLDFLESEIIDHAKSIGPVYNKRRGGGGSKKSATSEKRRGVKRTLNF